MFETLAEKVVTNGIDALDILQPEWLGSMPEDVSELDFMSVAACPLFYAFESFFDGYCAVSDAGYNVNECGFAEPNVALDYLNGERTMLFNAVNAEWHKRITELRNA